MKLVIRIPVVRIVVLKADIQTCRYHVVYLYSHNAKLGILAARAEGLGNISISRQRPSKENDFKSRRGVYLSKLSVGLFSFLCRPVCLSACGYVALPTARSTCRSVGMCVRMCMCTHVCSCVCTHVRTHVRTRAQSHARESCSPFHIVTMSTGCKSI
jgi:hypothetical protein